MKSKILFFIIIIFFISCGKDYNESTLNNINITITNPIKSLISYDHTSEGFLVKCQDGKIINIFRLDPGVNGDHIGNSSKIVKRISYDNGKTWKNTIEIYNSKYDDRNIHGGMMQDGTIVFFFRKYDASSKKAINIEYFYSKDLGETFHGPFLLDTNLTGGFGTDTLSYIPNKGYMMALNGSRDSKIDFYFTNDGKNWFFDDGLDYSQDINISMNESCFSYIGDSKIIGLIRNLNGKHAYYQIVSHDNGKTWSKPKLTNIKSTYNVVAPLCYYIKEIDSLLVIATNRCKPFKQQSLKIYLTPIKNIINNPLGHKIIKEVQNQESFDRYFYGYPSIVKIGYLEYLIIYTDNHTKSNGKEDANLYQFYIKLTKK